MSSKTASRFTASARLLLAAPLLLPCGSRDGPAGLLLPDSMGTLEEQPMVGG